MKFLITGATGPIGMALITLLERTGNEVTVLVNPSSRRNYHLESFAAQCIECAMGDYKGLKLDQHYDVFVHMAWRGGANREDFDENFKSLTDSIDALDLAKRSGCHTFLTTGSQSEYGPTHEILKEDIAKKPATSFAACKSAFSTIAEKKAQSLDMRFVSAKILSVYGPYDRESSVISQILRSLKDDTRLELSLGENYWDFLYSSDVAEALLLLIEQERCRGDFIIGCGNFLKLKDYFRLIEQSLSLQGGRLTNQCVRDDGYSLRCDVSKLKSETGWAPSISFMDGVIETYHAMQA